jgi:hypothetical protein
VLGKHSRDWSNEQLNAQDGQGAFDCHIRPHGVSFMQIKPYRMVVQKKPCARLPTREIATKKRKAPDPALHLRKQDSNEHT